MVTRGINKGIFGIYRFGMSKAVVKKDIIIMFVYSAIKMKAKFPALNSMLNPETSSDSPSGRSNGVRFVSARTVAIHTMAKGVFKKITGIRASFVAAEKSRLLWSIRK